MLTVQELIEALKHMPKNLPVCIDINEEDSSFVINEVSYVSFGTDVSEPYVSLKGYK